MWACPMATSAASPCQQRPPRPLRVCEAPPSPIIGNYADVNGHSVKPLVRFPGRWPSWFLGGYGCLRHPAGPDGQRPCVCRGRSLRSSRRTPAIRTPMSAVISRPLISPPRTAMRTLTVIFHLPPDVQSQEPRYHATQGGWPCPISLPPLTIIKTASPTPGSVARRSGAPPSTPSALPSPTSMFRRCHLYPTAFRHRRFDQWHCKQILAVSAVWLLHPAVRRCPDPGPRSTGINANFQYLPPEIPIEGHGIKRGLTAVEAGILMDSRLTRS